MSNDRLDRAPAGFVPPGQLWYPPVPEGFGPWVECDGVMPSVPYGTRIHALWKCEREDRRWTPCNGDYGFILEDWPERRTAYCVALEDQPTAAEIEATQQPWSPEQAAADLEADAIEANRPMFGADDVGIRIGKWDRHNARAALAPVTPAPPFMVAPVRSSDGLLTEWPVGGHRLGRFA